MNKALKKQQRMAGFEKLQNNALKIIGFIEQLRGERNTQAIEDGYNSASYTLHQLQQLPLMNKAKIGRAIEKLTASGRSFMRAPSEQNITKPYVFDLGDVRDIYEATGELSYAEKRSQFNLPHQCKVIGNQNLKGGVGKTTTGVTITTGLVHHKNLISKRLRVLIIDMDPQGSTTAAFGLSKQMHSAIEAITTQASPETVLSWVQPTASAGLSILPACSKDAFFSVTAYKVAEQQGVHVSELLMRNVIEPLKPHFDIIWLDTAPHLDASLLNCLAAADSLVVPVGLDPLELDSSFKFLASLNSMMSELPETRLSIEEIYLMASKSDMSNAQHLDNLQLLSHLRPLKVFRARMDQLRPFSMVAEDGRSVFTIQPRYYSGDTKSLRRAQAVAEDVVTEFYTTFLEL